MAAKKPDKPQGALKLKKMPTKAIEFTLEAVPGSPMVMNNLRAKTQIDMIRRRLLGLSTSSKGRTRSPYDEFMGARYINDDGVDCFPSHGAKLAICSALQFYNDIDLTMARARRVLQVNVGQDLTPLRWPATPNKEMIVFPNSWATEHEPEEESEADEITRKKAGIKKPKPAKTKEPEILYQCEIGDELPDFREDVVRLQGASKAPDLRYRPQYMDWEADITVSFKPDIITEASVANLVSIAGEMIGLCEWRPEKGGAWGMFRIKTARS